MLKQNDKVALVVCSNGKDENDKSRLENLEKILKEMNLVPIFTPYIYKQKYSRAASAKLRGEILMDFYKDEEIKAIFDISGGDLTNEILSYLDFEVIKANYKPFFGYSDLSTILNALVAKTEQKAYLYQILNIVDDEKRRSDFEKTLLFGKQSLTEVSWQFLQKGKIKGTVVGGNIRCFLKLAGTKYFPKLDNKVLFLEGMSTSIEGLITAFAQLDQLGAFEKISALLLGTFTKIEQDYNEKDIFEIVESFVSKEIPVAKTAEIGHARNSKMLVLGEKIEIN